MNTATNYQALFAELADDDELVAYAQQLIGTGQASWIRDPYVDGVVGLVLTGTNTALVLLYLKTPSGFNDFETSEEFDAAAYGAQA